MDRDMRLTGVFRAQSDNPEAPLGFELNNPWKVCNPRKNYTRFCTDRCHRWRSEFRELISEIGGLHCKVLYISHHGLGAKNEISTSSTTQMSAGFDTPSEPHAAMTFRLYFLVSPQTFLSSSSDQLKLMPISCAHDGADCLNKCNKVIPQS